MNEHRPARVGKPGPIDPSRIAAGDWLRSLRHKCALTAQDVADKIDSSVVFIRRLEAGRDRLPRYLWPTLADVYNVDDRRSFAISLIKYYDVVLYGLLFGTRDNQNPQSSSRSHRKITVDETLRRIAAGKWLTQQIAEAGISIELVAKHLEITPAYIHEIDRGGNRVAVDRYADVAEILRLDPRHLAVQMTRFYDPELYEMLFGNVPVRRATETIATATY